MSDGLTLLSVKEVSELSGVSVKTIRRAIDGRTLAHVRIGSVIRVTQAQYLDWIRRNTKPVVL